MKDRLDKLLVERGIVSGRERARALIMEGKVFVKGMGVMKAGTLVDRDVPIEVRGEDIPYVGRGGLKLVAALEFFGLSVTDKVVMDVGASTGGFTDCLLQRGARRVYCVDVGYGQLAWKLRQDQRVVLLERTNIRHLDKERIPDAIDLSTVDVSFISLVKVIPKVIEFLKPRGEIIALIKPQFEVGRGEVDKGGVVKSEEKRLGAVNRVKEELQSLELRPLGIFESPIPGQKGNREYFIYLACEE